ncbi:MAG: hypothetical protein ACI9FJ_002818 [Alteromonadaceae bacterium]|jgi:hypothetical protein
MTQISKYSIALRSSLPGRGRWDIDALKSNDMLAKRIKEVLTDHQDIFTVTANANTGRVLVIFHCYKLSADGIAQILEEIVTGQDETENYTSSKTNFLKTNDPKAKFGSDHITQFRVTVLFMVGTTSAPRTSSKTQ